MAGKDDTKQRKNVSLVRDIGNKKGKDAPKSPELENAFSAQPSALIQADREALKAWRFYGGRLSANLLIDNLDVAALENFCIAYSKWQAAEKRLKKLDKLVLKSADGGYYQHPEVSLATQFSAQVFKWGKVLGLNPRDRYQLKVPGGKKTESPFND